MSNGGSESQRSTSPGRPIPKRGQVKGRIVKGLANSVVAAIFSLATNSVGACIYPSPLAKFWNYYYIINYLITLSSFNNYSGSLKKRK